MNPYVPQPGTMPFRVIEHLKTLPAGTELSSASLGEALNADAGSMSALLMHATRAGAVWRRSNPVVGCGRNSLLWSLPIDGVAAQQAVETDDDEDGEPDRLPVTQRQVSAGDAEPLMGLQRASWCPTVEIGITVVGPRKKASQAKSAEKTVEGDGPRRLMAASPQGAMRVALWSDGQLVCHRAEDEPIVFTKAEASVLVRYIERMAGAPA